MEQPPLLKRHNARSVSSGHLGERQEESLDWEFLRSAITIITSLVLVLPLMYEGKGIAKLTDPVLPLSTRRRHRQKKVEKKDLQLGEGPRARLRGVLKDFFDF